MESSEHFGDNYTILGWHIHAHQQDRRAEIHSHYLGHYKNDDIWGFAGGDFVEEFCECQEEATNGGDDNTSDEEKGDVLWPESDIHFKAAPMDGDFDAARHGVFLANAIEYYVDGALKVVLLEAIY